jgi:CheY-like chemotaxis protein
MDSNVPDLKSLRVCVADDDPDLRDLLTRMLQRLGHQVVCVASDGQRLLVASTEHQFDLVIVDLDMPVMDGLAAAEELFLTKRIPSILLSGHVDIGEVVVEKEPIAGYLTKPISMSELDHAIRDAITRGINGKISG